MNTTSKSSGNPVPMKGFSSSQLRTLTFGPSFNQPLSGELPELRSLRFGHDWNHPLDFLSFPKAGRVTWWFRLFWRDDGDFWRKDWVIFSASKKRIIVKLSRWGSGLGMWKGSETEMNMFDWVFTLKNNKARNTEIEVYKGKAHLSKTILRKRRVSWIELMLCLPTLDMMDMEISSRGLERLANWRKRIRLKS